MKNVLLASTAIVAAAALASPANAADRVKLSLGGFMEQYIGFADNEEDPARDFAAFDQQNDSEVYFSGTTTLDNGIKIGVRLELEGDAAAGANMDEAWLDIQTAWGSIRLGEEDVMTDLQAIEPAGGIITDYDNWVVPVGVTTNDDTYNVGSSGDDNMIHYLSPKIFGFQAGVSYTPEVGNNGEVMPNRVTDSSSGIAATLNWSGELGPVAIDAGYGYYHEGGDSSGITPSFTAHNGGVNLTFGAFGVGGSYGRHLGNPVGIAGGWTYKAGVWYGEGPILVGFQHIYQQNDGTVGDGGRHDENTVNAVFLNYELSDGVKWESMIFHADFDEEANLDATENDGGWGVVGGLRLDF